MDRNISPVERAALIEKYRHLFVGTRAWANERVAEWHTTLQDRGIDNPRINFSGPGSQGHGASFTGAVEYPEKFMQEHFIDQFKYLQWAAKHDAVSIFLIRDQACRYYHEFSVEVALGIYEDGPIIGPDPLEIAAAEVYFKLAAEELNDLHNSLEDLFVSWMREIYKSLEDLYEHLTSDEVVWDWIECNVCQDEINDIIDEDALTTEA